MDGRFLYVSNRGHNSIAIFAINKINGRLKAIGHKPTKGITPRNFAISPNGNFLVVANQHSKSLVSFKRNNETGMLLYEDKLEAPSPVIILF